MRSLRNFKSSKIVKNLRGLKRNPRNINLTILVFWLILTCVQNIGVSGIGIQTKSKINIIDSKKAQQNIENNPPDSKDGSKFKPPIFPPIIGMTGATPIQVTPSDNQGANFNDTVNPLVALKYSGIANSQEANFLESVSYAFPKIVATPANDEGVNLLDTVNVLGKSSLAFGNDAGANLSDLVNYELAYTLPFADDLSSVYVEAFSSLLKDILPIAATPSSDYGSVYSEAFAVDLKNILPITATPSSDYGSVLSDVVTANVPVTVAVPINVSISDDEGTNLAETFAGWLRIRRFVDSLTVLKTKLALPSDTEDYTESFAASLVEVSTATPINATPSDSLDTLYADLIAALQKQFATFSDDSSTNYSDVVSPLNIYFASFITDYSSVYAESLTARLPYFAAFIDDESLNLTDSVAALNKYFASFVDDNTLNYVDTLTAKEPYLASFIDDYTTEYSDQVIGREPLFLQNITDDFSTLYVDLITAIKTTAGSTPIIVEISDDFATAYSEAFLSLFKYFAIFNDDYTAVYADTILPKFPYFASFVDTYNTAYDDSVSGIEKQFATFNDDYTIGYTDSVSALNKYFAVILDNYTVVYDDTINPLVKNFVSFTDDYTVGYSDNVSALEKHFALLTDDYGLSLSDSLTKSLLIVSSTPITVSDITDALSYDDIVFANNKAIGALQLLPSDTLSYDENILGLFVYKAIDIIDTQNLNYSDFLTPLQTLKIQGVSDNFAAPLSDIVGVLGTSSLTFSDTLNTLYNDELSGFFKYRASDISDNEGVNYSDIIAPRFVFKFTNLTDDVASYLDDRLAGALSLNYPNAITDALTYADTLNNIVTICLVIAPDTVADNFLESLDGLFTQNVQPSDVLDNLLDVVYKTEGAYPLFLNPSDVYNVLDNLLKEKRPFLCTALAIDKDANVSVLTHTYFDDSLKVKKNVVTFLKITKNHLC